MPQQIGDGTAAIAPYRVLCWSLTAIWLSISLADVGQHEQTECVESPQMQGESLPKVCPCGSRKPKPCRRTGKAQGINSTTHNLSHVRRPVQAKSPGNAIDITSAKKQMHLERGREEETPPWCHQHHNSQVHTLIVEL